MTERRDPAPVLPGATIGILGGGQLGRMIALSARAMGYRIVTLDPTPDAPCGQVADRQVVAAYDDLEAARSLARDADVVTYEFENVDADVAAALAASTRVPQGAELLAIAQHRIREKTAIESAGVPVAPWRPVRNRDELERAVAELGTPSVLKTATGGYDGKGQRVLRDAADAAAAWQELGGAGREMVLEAFVAFELELSVVVARSARGEVEAFPATENVHVDNILMRSIVPARIAPDVADRAAELATTLAEVWDAVGLLAVEMFLTTEGDLLVNEVAPRPHNSGHWTMDACATSQFEQHVRAVCGLALGSTRVLTPAVMVNVLGEHVEPLRAWLASGGEHMADVDPKIHLYGKAEVRPGRKMGHVNVLAEDVERARSWIDGCGIWT